MHINRAQLCSQFIQVASIAPVVCGEINDHQQRHNAYNRKNQSNSHDCAILCNSLFRIDD
jgi:hypothetical protein